MFVFAVWVNFFAPGGPKELTQKISQPCEFSQVANFRRLRIFARSIVPAKFRRAHCSGTVAQACICFDIYIYIYIYIYIWSSKVVYKIFFCFFIKNKK